MSYTFEQLKEDVRKEAESLRQHATKDELEKLDFGSLKPTHYDNCIYGQMTGDCFSPRSAFLIFNCCNRYFKSWSDHDEYLEYMEEFALAGRVVEMVNGNTIDGVNDVDQLRNHREGPNASHFSAIEAYIMTPLAHNKELIAYLRGETETLDL